MGVGSDGLFLSVRLSVTAKTVLESSEETRLPAKLPGPANVPPTPLEYTDLILPNYTRV